MTSMSFPAKIYLNTKSNSDPNPNPNSNSVFCYLLPLLAIFNFIRSLATSILLVLLAQSSGMTRYNAVYFSAPLTWWRTGDNYCTRSPHVTAPSRGVNFSQSSRPLPCSLPSPSPLTHLLSLPFPLLPFLISRAP